MTDTLTWRPRAQGSEHEALTDDGRRLVVFRGPEAQQWHAAVDGQVLLGPHGGRLWWPGRKAAERAAIGRAK